MTSDRQRVSGIGGTFLLSRDPEALADWYEQHLGMPVQREEHAVFSVFAWRRERDGRRRTTTWAVMDYDGEPGNTPTATVNYHVDDLDAMLRQLRADGLAVTDIQDLPYGRFAWLHDPDGNRIELYQEAEGLVQADYPTL